MHGRFRLPAGHRCPIGGGEAASLCGAYQTLGITQGNGERDALWQAADCLEEAIAGRVAGGREIPKASKAARGERLTPVRAPMAAKAVLYLAMREAGMTNTNVQLARKLGCDEKEVRRMLDPRHPTKLPRITESVSGRP